MSNPGNDEDTDLPSQDFELDFEIGFSSWISSQDLLGVGDFSLRGFQFRSTARPRWPKGRTGIGMRPTPKHLRRTIVPWVPEVSLSRAAGIFVVGRRPSEKNPLGPRVELGLRRGIPICQVRISSWISAGAYDRLLISSQDVSPGALPYERSGDAHRKLLIITPNRSLSNLMGSYPKGRPIWAWPTFFYL